MEVEGFMFERVLGVFHGGLYGHIRRVDGGSEVSSNSERLGNFFFE